MTLTHIIKASKRVMKGHAATQGALKSSCFEGRGFSLAEKPPKNTGL